MNKHQKHSTLIKPQAGKYGCQTLSLMGGDPHTVKRLVEATAKSLRVAWIKNSISRDFSKEVLLFGENGELESRFEYRSITVHRQLAKLFLNYELVFEEENDRDADGILVFDNESQVLPDDIIAVCGGVPVDETPYFSKKAIDRLVSFIVQWLKNQLKTPLNGLLLIGGKSSRMKRDKSSLHYFSKNQRERGVELLKSYCDEIFISCRKEQINFVEDKINYLEDTFVGLGPLGGIMTAQQHNPNVAWLVIACDLPLLDKATIKFLVTNRNPIKSATVFLQPNTTFPEPLITIWEPKSYQHNLNWLFRGYTCPRKVLINTSCEVLNIENKDVLMNANTPEDYQKIKHIIRQKDVK